MKRRICYLTGTRADFGGVATMLVRAGKDPRLSLSLCATGMHLLPRFGRTIDEVRATGLPVIGEIPVDLSTDDGAMMARAIGRVVIGMTDILQKHPQDALLVHGDRGEMLAAAIAAIHLNIPVFHLHGGERTGTVDEPVRHAISKLSHYHLTSTPGARRRLVRMGETPSHIFVTGAPSLDGIVTAAKKGRASLARKAGLDPDRPIALVLFHAVLQDADLAQTQMAAILEATLAAGYQILCLRPNSDAGGLRVNAAIDAFESAGRLHALAHLPRGDYLSWLAAADIMMGNSSSGIVEAASFGLPVVNVGDRQAGRERSGNVVDSAPERRGLTRAIEAARRLKGRKFRNIYGDGNAGRRIVELLATKALSSKLLRKSNAY